MKEKELEKREQGKMKEMKRQPSKNLKIVMNLIDSLLAGKRFAEMDGKKQMYLLGCQTKIREMQEGYFDEGSVTFLYSTINSLLNQLEEARDELRIIGSELEKEGRIDDEFVQ